MFARNIMDKKFHSLGPGQSITDAVRMFKSAGIVENKKIFGMMVMDSKDRLVGMISMYDILLFIQPKHIRILGEMEDLPAEPLFEGVLNRINNVRVEDLMTTDLIIVGPETHLIMVMDIMIQKHIRRLPVVEKNKVIGIVYRSDLFYHFLETMVGE